MTPRDQVIGDIVRKQIQDFMVKFVPTEIKAQCEVKAGGHEMSTEAVRALVVDDYETALNGFRQAIAEDVDDHKSLFGAGVCCEKLENYAKALKYYKQARSIKPKETQYGAAVKRVSAMSGEQVARG
jgi:tetratricopeptide (TPR) repeat protein